MALVAAQQPAPIVVFEVAHGEQARRHVSPRRASRSSATRPKAVLRTTPSAREGLEVMVRRPTCSTQMCPNAKKGDAWLTAPTTADCFNKLVGFHFRPSHTPFCRGSAIGSKR